MKRWLLSLAVGLPIGLTGMLPDMAQARDGWHRHHYQGHHRHHGHRHHWRHFRHHHYYRPYYYGYGYYPYYQHYHRHGDFYGVHTPWGSFHWYDD